MTDQCQRCGQPFTVWTSSVLPQYCPLCLQAVREALGKVILETDEETMWLDFTEESDDD